MLVCHVPHVRPTDRADLNRYSTDNDNDDARGNDGDDDACTAN